MAAALLFFPYATSEIGYCADSFHFWNSGRAAYRQTESGNCQRLLAGAAVCRGRQTGPEHERGKLSRFRRCWGTSSAVRPPKKQIAEVCAGGSYSTRRGSDAGFRPGEALAELCYGRRSLRSLVVAGKNFRNFLDSISSWESVRRPRRMHRKQSVRNANLIRNHQPEHQAQHACSRNHGPADPREAISGDGNRHCKRQRYQHHS